MPSSKQFDGSLDSNSFRLIRGEQQAYVKTSQRSLLPFNSIEEAQSQFTTRQDVRVMHQTSWADGSFWNKPLLSSTSIRSYYLSQGMDVVTIPGDVIPRPATSTVTPSSSIHERKIALQVAQGEVYYFSDAATRGLRRYDGDGTWSTVTNTFGSTAEPIAMCYDRSTDTVYALFDDGQVSYITLDSAGGTVIDVGNVYQGANIFIHNGRLMVYNGDVLYEVEDPLGTPATSTVYDDGMGPDYLEAAAVPAAPVFDHARLAISTAEGLWILKNVEQEGKVVPFLHRVDRNAAGTDIGTPLGTLRPGSAALDIAYHLGGILMSTATDMEKLLVNDASTAFVPITIHFYDSRAGFGTVGSPLGSVNPDESPYRFLGVDRDFLYIGGDKRVWVYDVVNGGLHPWLEDDYASNGGAFQSIVWTNDGTDDVILLGHWDASNLLKQKTELEGSGTEGEHWLESNYFDFNLPSEQKVLSHVTVFTDGINAGETWSVDVETDDGSWVEVATFTDADALSVKKRLGTLQQGYRFRYRVRWDHSGGTENPPSHLKGIIFHGIQGELVRRFQLTIDGKTFRNVEGAQLRSDDVETWLDTLAENEAVVVFNDEFGKDTAVAYNVKVDGVTISREDGDEFVAQVVLTEDT